MSVKNIFTNIYLEKIWNEEGSISGPGSDASQTRIIVEEIPKLIREHNIQSVLDVPCGDFYWMKNIDLSHIHYTGGDIVDQIIEQNRQNFGRHNIDFISLNLIEDPLPRHDLVLCRDCFVHFSIRDIFLALSNICNSKSKYLLTTTFPDSWIREYCQPVDNEDIETGNWRPLNLASAPFFFPEPAAMIREGCTEAQGFAEDKSLGLWDISEIRQSLKQNQAYTDIFGV